MKEEYISRINRVLDYIEKHLDENMSLDDLARVAHFSRFHFHRVFHAMVGETLHQFIQRLRLEKAASSLILHPKKSVTEVALDSGFSSSAAFARAFKDFFQMSASDWRAGGHLHDRKIRQTDRNMGRSLSNTGKDFDVSSAYIDPVTQNFKWRITMAAEKPLNVEVEVKDLPEMHVAYVRHVGPYKGDSQLFEGLFGRLMQWAGPRGLMRPPETQTISVYHDDPNVTEEAKLRVSACITVPKDTPVDGEIGKMTLRGGKYAVGHFELSTDQYTEAWNAIFQGWLPQSGYEPDDSPCFELYLNDPSQHPEHKCVVDICVPVRPM